MTTPTARDLAARMVSPALAVLTLVYASLALLNLAGPWITGAPIAPRATLFTASAAASLCAGAWLIVRKRPVSATWANPVLAGLGLLMAMTSSIYLWLVPDPVHTGNHMLASIAIGSVIISRRWLAITLAGVMACWLVPALAGPLDEDWFHWGAMLVLSQFFAASIAEFRLRTTLRLIELRRVAEERLHETEREAKRRERAEARLREAERTTARAKLVESALAVQQAKIERLELERDNKLLESRVLEIGNALTESQQSLAAQQPLAAIGTLSAGIAHQIKNPVGSILNSASYALLEHGDGDEDNVRIAALKEIHASAARCGRILKNVLNFSRTESTEMWKEELDGLIMMAVKVTAPAAREHHANCEIQLAPGKPQILMNPIALEQVVVNLIQNAIESKPTGVHVRISTRPIGGEMEIAVEDDGPGLPAEAAQHLFEAFYTTKGGQGGSGLGLAVARKIVEAHKGRIFLGSEETDDLHQQRLPGACFLIRLPAT